MSVPIQWRTKKQRYSLQGSVCPECSNVMFPPRSVCPHCSADHSAAQVEATVAHSSNGRLSQRLPRTVAFAMPAAPEPMAVAAGGDD